MKTETFNAQDFTFAYDKYGYMIAYKGKNIGGAGVAGKPSMHWRHAKQNMADFAESARREINSICEGNGSKYLMDAITKINAQ